MAPQLVPAASDGARYPALEIMVATHAVRNLIRKGEDHQIYTALATGRAEGMITMEYVMIALYRHDPAGASTSAAR